jgi:hypothetical protein
MFDPLEQSEMSDLTVTTLGTSMLTMQHDLLFSICCIQDPRDFLQRTSPDILSVKESSFYI